MARKAMEVKVGGAGKRATLKDQESRADGVTKKRASKKSAKAKEGNGNVAN